MSIIRNAKEFFGLTPVDLEHDDAYYDEEPRYRSSGSSAYAPSARDERDRDYDYGYGREERPRYTPAPVEPKLVSVTISTFNEATRIGEPFRDGDAVVFDITGMEHAARIIDFAAGLCYALRGSMVNVSKHLQTERTVFAIVPEDAHFSQVELERASGLR